MPRRVPVRSARCPADDRAYARPARRPPRRSTRRGPPSGPGDPPRPRRVGIVVRSPPTGNRPPGRADGRASQPIHEQNRRPQSESTSGRHRRDRRERRGLDDEPAALPGLDRGRWRRRRGRGDRRRGRVGRSRRPPGGGRGRTDDPPTRIDHHDHVRALGGAGRRRAGRDAPDVAGHRRREPPDGRRLVGDHTPGRRRHGGLRRPGQRPGRRHGHPPGQHQGADLPCRGVPHGLLPGHRRPPGVDVGRGARDTPGPTAAPRARPTPSSASGRPRSRSPSTRRGRRVPTC